ncbi:hypothetical protein [Salinimonas iocasae]|uniref:Uncharacterized protein n=1 Tax=Salinimonas iocasae TaxID=2572577 RepID=A0A5B7Y9K1_9ALTE|nr:hypothetical protein [Salinimonas iocasae]QCZ92457.1 hypothetical protein FBQ74_02755 [Salinimonas iocasae]
MQKSSVFRYMNALTFGLRFASYTSTAGNADNRLFKKDIFIVEPASDSGFSEIRALLPHPGREVRVE